MKNLFGGDKTNQIQIITVIFSNKESITQWWVVLFTRSSLLDKGPKMENFPFLSLNLTSSAPLPKLPAKLKIHFFRVGKVPRALKEQRI